MRALVAAVLWVVCGAAAAQDYEREQRWADQILPALMVGDAVWLTQKEGHNFLTLYTEAKNARGAVILAHGRGWSPDYELYGMLRTKIAEAGYTTLAIQLPVLGGGAKIGDYIPTYPDARERFQLAADFLKGKGYKNIAIVSHSLGATMANQYLINTDDKTVKAWVFIGIINGLEEMFRIKDWEITQVGAYERKKQIMKIKGSDQIVVPEALHFFEGREDELTRIVVSFLDQVFHDGSAAASGR